jgi:hypothetical protein
MPPPSAANLPTDWGRNLPPCVRRRRIDGEVVLTSAHSRRGRHGRGSLTGAMGGGWLFTGGNLLEISDIFSKVQRPGTSIRRRILIQKMVGSDFHGRPCSTDQNPKHNDNEADVPPKPDFGYRQHYGPGRRLAISDSRAWSTMAANVSPGKHSSAAYRWRSASTCAVCLLKGRSLSTIIAHHARDECCTGMSSGQRSALSTAWLWQFQHDMRCAVAAVAKTEGHFRLAAGQAPPAGPRRRR